MIVDFEKAFSDIKLEAISVITMKIDPDYDEETNLNSTTMLIDIMNNQSETNFNKVVFNYLTQPEVFKILLDKVLGGEEFSRPTTASTVNDEEINNIQSNTKSYKNIKTVIALIFNVVNIINVYYYGYESVERKYSEDII